MRVLILSNPGARNNRDHSRSGELVKYLMAGGARIELMSIRENSFRHSLSAREISKWDRIIAIGGDGTLSSLAQILVKRENPPPLAIFPGGTVNDFATSSAVPTEPQLFCEGVLRGNTKNVDLGLCNGRFFINVLSAGHFTDAVSTVNSRAKSILGPAAYYIEGMRKFSADGIAPFRLSWKCEQGSGSEDVMALVAANGPSVAGFKGLAPQGNYSDGLLDVIIIRACDAVDLIALFLVALSRSHLDDYRIIHLRTDKIEFLPEKTLSFTADGDAGGDLPGTVEIRSNCLTMIDFS